MLQIIQPQKYSYGLAYPAGVAPGFDPTHIASTNTLFSAAVLGGNHVNILNGKPGVITGSPTPKILGALGPSVNYPVGGKSVFATAIATNYAEMTMAAFVQFDTATAAAIRDVIGNSITSTSSGYRFGASSAANFLWTIAGASTASSIPVVANVPYFIATSIKSATRGNVAVCRLDTGQIFTDTAATATTAVVGGTNYTVGNRDDTIRGTVGAVGPVMMSDVFLSVQQLAFWAADPWSFWYPQK
jgi:hypothetical protein